ncbi:MAG: hypothetical protein M5U19_21675 [Microthrixaceae bacterium]|nr:hypothetical protein [Microthrixaceae bacterium]
MVVVDPVDDTTPWAVTPDGHRPVLGTSALDRHLDRARTRLSFTAITARGGPGAADPHSDSDGDAGSEDEGQHEELGGPIGLSGTGDPDDGDTRLPLGSIPGGAAFGTLVHSVLEQIDFTSEDLEGDLHAAIGQAHARNPWPVDTSVLVQGLAAAVNTPLGPCSRATASPTSGGGTASTRSASTSPSVRPAAVPATATSVSCCWITWR